VKPGVDSLCDLLLFEVRRVVSIAHQPRHLLQTITPGRLEP
jgi:hypothetical protein